VSNLSNQPLSPLDGRYQPAVAGLGEYLSEAGLNKARVHVEVEWLIHLANRNLLKNNAPLDLTEIDRLRNVVTNFSDDDVATLAKTRLNKTIEYGWLVQPRCQRSCSDEVPTGGPSLQPKYLVR